MSYRYLHLGQILYFLLSIQSNTGFVCRKDGRWPHPADCEKFYTCNSGVGVETWCGNGMTFDVDHSRCDLSRNIDCKNGERPNWIPPFEWQTKNMIITTTPSIFYEEKTMAKPTTIFSPKLAFSRLLLPTIVLIENSPCGFQGNLPDQDNYQSYFVCKDESVTRFQCPDKHLFDGDLRSCNDYRKVYCGNRPVHEHGNDPCMGQPNGWYADHGNQCRSYYLCTDQRKNKISECPIGSKWNPHRLRCDDPRYIAAPCGYRVNHADAFLGHHASTILMIFTFFLLLLTF